MEIPLLRDILVIFGLSIFVLLICHRMKLPPVVGYLITGIVGGPGGFALVKGVDDVETLSKIGIVLLLFTVGLEFSLKKIIEYKRYFFFGGALQVALTIASGYLISSALGRPQGEALFLGFLLSLSSTAIVLKLLQEKNETSTPHGNAIVGILVFQDVVAIPMMLLLPLLGGEKIDFDIPFFARVIGGFALLVAVFLAATYIIPRLLDLITRTRSKELFLLTVLVICFSVAYFSSLIGLSLSIGAFLAGLIISESEYSMEAIGDVLPFRDIFTSFFFVSTGMMVNVQFILEHPGIIVALCAAILAGKALIGTTSILAVGLPLRSAIISGLAISQIGEFSLVLAKQGLVLGLGTSNLSQLFLDVSVLTMAFTPLLMSSADRIAKIALKLPLPQTLKSGFSPPSTKVHLKDHVIIVGFGISGRNIARSLKEAAIPYVILEMNSDTVKKEKKLGQPIHYGDGTHETVLQHLDIQHAKAVAVVINDSIAALKTVEVARNLNPSIFIISRTHRVQEMNLMYKLGANEVIPDEFGTSVEMFTRLLRLYQITNIEIDKLITTIRQEGYEMLREYYKAPATLKDVQQDFAEVKLETYKVEFDSKISGKTVLESQLRVKYGLTVMLIKRGEETISSIEPSLVFQTGDRVVLLGPHNKLKEAYELFHSVHTNRA